MSNCNTGRCGDRIGPKAQNVLRIGGQNFGGLLSDVAKVEQDDEAVRMWINQQKLDVIAIQEINLHWPKVSDKLQFNERVHGWWPRGTTNHTFSYNKHWKLASVTQWGGTAMISRNQATF